MISTSWGGAFAAGDNDGDGCSDIVFATSAQDYDDNAGTTHIFSGPLLGEVDPFEDWTHTLVAEPNDWAYNPTSGDVNGDGLADWVIEGYNIQGGLGGAYVAFGPITASMALGDEADALLIAQGGVSGWDDLEAADLDDDGLDDLLIGALYHTTDDVRYGAVYIAHGPVSGTSWLADTGTIITTGDDGGAVGACISAGGDTNGDGLPEVALGSGSYSSARGGVWIFEPPLSGTLTTDDADASFVGEAYGQAGDAVSSGGDVDGDGYGDLLVGAWDYANMQGRAYLVLGPFDGSSSLRNADAIVEADGICAEVGEAVSLEQDLDADGRADVVIGAPGAVGAPYEGAVFVFYETFEGTVNAFDEADAVLYSESKDGWAVTGGRLGPAGDVNGDGFDDLHIHGEVEYLVFGGVR